MPIYSRTIPAKHAIVIETPTGPIVIRVRGVRHAAATLEVDHPPGMSVRQGESPKLNLSRPLPKL